MNILEKTIKEEIRLFGPMTFARFMEIALYYVPGGYYTSSKEFIGALGDFYTSPIAHPAFGSLLAIQLEQMWLSMGSPSTFYTFELGSGKGSLARDIQTYVQYLSKGFRDSLRYVTIDRSAASDFNPAEPIAANGIPVRDVVGCILSNELIDAMPVHRVVVRDGNLKEVIVETEGEYLVERYGDPSTPLLQNRLNDLGVTLSESQEAEINLGLPDLVRSMSDALAEGYIITIDYGYEARKLYEAARKNGTLMCHFRHTKNREPLKRIGQQDITSHADFTSLVILGQKFGLEKCGLLKQSDLLRNLGLDSYLQRLRNVKLPSGSYHSNLMGIRNLVDREGLGSFLVCVQTKGQLPKDLWGLGYETNIAKSVVDRLPIPLLADHHIDLLKGKYPHMAWDPSSK